MLGMKVNDLKGRHAFTASAFGLREDGRPRREDRSVVLDPVDGLRTYPGPVWAL